MKPDMVTKPDDDEVGWCHSCETHQRGRHARWVELYWNPGWWAWVCVRCDGEPWGIGVWGCKCAECVEDPALEGSECWQRVFGGCADALCSRYPEVEGCPDHPVVV